MRRPIAAREAGWAKNFARFLARRGISPNAVSGASVAFAALAALCLVGAGQNENRIFDFVLFCGAALFIQLRLLCNLFDGMLAVEFEKSSALGPLWNDFPDRPADVLVLAGCGFCGGASWLPLLGFFTASLALMTAYVRVLGVAVGARETFVGPMAKPHRMAMATIACGLSALESWLYFSPRAMAAALLIISLGCVITIVRRLNLVSRDLKIAARDASTRASAEREESW